MCQSLDILSQINICCQGEGRHGWGSDRQHTWRESAHCREPWTKGSGLFMDWRLRQKERGRGWQWKAAESGWRKVPQWGPRKEASKCWHLYLSSSLRLHPENPSVSSVGRAVSPMIPVSLMTLLMVEPERSRIGSWPGMISNFKIGNNVNRLVLLVYIYHSGESVE